MPKENFNQKLIARLKTHPDFIDESGELLPAAVKNHAWQLNHNLIKLLLTDEKIKTTFFDEIDGHWIFNHNTFIDYINTKNFLANSYTQFRNKIGLNIDDKFLRERGEVSLVWPYKDCVLEGERQTKPEREKHCITIIHNPRGVQGANFSYIHEYAFFVIPKGKKVIGDREILAEEITWNNFRNWGGESRREDAKNCFYPVIVEDGEVVGFGDVLDDDEHPSGQTVTHGKRDFVYPIDQNMIERKWRYARQSVEEIKHLLRARETKTGYEIELGKDFGMYRTVWEDKRYDANIYGTQLVKSLVPDCEFDFPKSLWNVYDCLRSVVENDRNAIVLDFFGGSGTLNIAVATPKEHAGLQAVDYFIWALQRLYERGEDQYLVYLWKAFGFIYDIDDTRKTDYGVYYTQNRPLTAAALRGRK